MTLVCKTIASPVGALKLVANDGGLCAILWEHEPPTRVRIAAPVENPEHALLCETASQLGDYFAGTRRHFDLPLAFTGTDFQKRVWSALLDIPFGETRTYAQIAERIGDRKAVRAVGAANGRNPLSIVVPCHRVIGSNGSLTGFAGGIASKRFLLALEGASPAKAMTQCSLL